MIFNLYTMYGPCTYGGTYDGHYIYGRLDVNSRVRTYATDTTGAVIHNIVGNGEEDDLGYTNTGDDTYFQAAMSRYYPSLDIDFSAIPIVACMGASGIATRFDRRDMALLNAIPTTTGLSPGSTGVTVSGDSLFVAHGAYSFRKVNLLTMETEATVDIRTFTELPIKIMQSFRDFSSDGTYLYTVCYAYPFVVKWRLSDLQPVAWYGTGEYYSGTLAFPFGVLTDGEYVWVMDTGNTRVVKLLASDMSYVSAFGSTGTGYGQFRGGVYQATSTRPGGQGDLIISDAYRIHKFTKGGTPLAMVGDEGGSGQDQFNVCYGITSDGTYFYVYDSYNRRIQKRLISDLSHVQTFNTAGDQYSLGFIDQQAGGIWTLEDGLDPFPTKGRGYIIG